ATQHAGDVGAHRDVMPAGGAGLKHRIKGGDLIHLDGRHAEILGHRVHGLTGQITAVLMLYGMQCGNHRRALAIGRNLRHPMIDFLAHMLAEHLAGIALHVAAALAHRSTSPNTMSWVPITATTSASRCPRTISSMADRWAKPGARHFSR